MKTILLWESETERREKAICILKSIDQNYQTNANIKSYDLMSAAVVSLCKSDMKLNIPSKITTVEDIALTISSFYQKIAITYFL